MTLLKLIPVTILFLFSANAANAQEVLKKAEEGTVLKTADTSPKTAEKSTVDEKQTWERSRNPNYKEPEPAAKKEEEKAITEKSKSPQ
ncbi:MAG: hypothetical protein IPH89_08520 [Bacteroidetes bacterium]|nr:hypothetical protein [Bacteroidota bacterium]